MGTTCKLYLLLFTIISYTSSFGQIASWCGTEHGSPEGTPSTATSSGAELDDCNIRVLFLYDEFWETNAGFDLKEKCLGAIDYINQALDNSQIYPNRFELGAVLFYRNECGDFIRDANGVYNGDLFCSNFLGTSGVHSCAIIQEYRDLYDIDIVIYLSPDNHPVYGAIACGEPNQNELPLDIYSYIAFASPVLVTSDLFEIIVAHEIGHLMGGHHDIDNVGDIFGNIPTPLWARAHIFNSGSNEVATVMGGDINFDYIPHFSNPNVSYNGIPSGLIDRNNVAHINQKIGYLSAHRETSIDLVIDNHTLVDLEYVFNKVKSTLTYNSIQIEDGATFLATTENSIKLKPGFHAQEGSDFHGYISNAICTNDNSSSISSNQGHSSQSRSWSKLEKGTESSATNVYPNPSTGLLYFNLTGNNEDKALVDITIYNAQGRMVLESSNLGTKMQFDISNLDSGMYFGIIETEQKTIQRFKFFRAP